jgi:subtilisin family serine protease
MKKLVALCLSFAVSSLFFIPQKNVYSQLRKGAGPLYAEDHIVVKLKEGVEPSEVSEPVAEQVIPGRGARMEQLLAGAHNRLQLLRLDGAISVEDAVRRASADPRVEYAEPDYFVYANDTVPNDPMFTDMWGLSDLGCLTCTGGRPGASINATKAWDITTGSSDVVAAVIDTGIDLSHPDLAANAWTNPNEIAGNNVDDDGNGYIDDVNGWNFYSDEGKVYKGEKEDLHGTHVAGTIGAEGNNGIGVTGVAWSVKLMSLKFLGGEKGRGSTADAVKAIDYAIEMKKRGVNIRVINSSWGGSGYSLSLRDAIAAAGKAGILFVCAAGNDGEDSDESAHYPSGYSTELSNVVSVAAMTSSDRLATFSNYGHTSVSVAAPGQSIMSTLPGGAYGKLSGTSMASPYVAGIAVLLFTREPQLTPAEAKKRIVTTSVPTAWLVSRVEMSGRADADSILTNSVAPARAPEIVSVSAGKKELTIDGFGFAGGSALIEVNGVPLEGVKYDSSYALANGTLTRLSAAPGKKGMKKLFPAGQQVSVTVYNPATGERSATFMSVRF